MRTVAVDEGAAAPPHASVASFPCGGRHRFLVDTVLPSHPTPHYPTLDNITLISYCAKYHINRAEMTGVPSNASFRALADETRREILRLLRDGPRTSGEIAARFSSTWPTVSRHLALLREARLVLTERKSQEIYYELNTSVLQELVQHLLDWVAPTSAATKPARRSRAHSRRQQEA
jgi:ArsR family transcriptional regulator